MTSAVTEKTPLLTDSSNSTSAAGSSSETTDTKSVSKSWTRQQKLVAIALSLQNISLCISFGIIAPFYPSEAAKKGATKTEVGLVFGVFQLIMFLVSPIYGNFIDRIGAKYMFISGSFLLGGCSIAFGFLDMCPNGMVYVVMCFLSRSIEANGCAMLSTASFAIMAKTFPDDVGKALGILETFSGIGMVLGPSIGGGLYSVGGYKLPFMVVGGLVWTITLIAYFILPDIGDMSRMEGSILQLLKIPGCLVIYLVIAACAIALSFLDPTFSPFMQDQFTFLTVAQIGLIFMIAPGVYAFSAPLAGVISDKGYLASSTIVGLIMCGSSFLLFGPSPLLQSFIPLTVAETCIGLVFMGLSIGFALIPVFPLVINLARNAGFEEGIQTLGIVSGYFNSGFSLGGFLGPTVAGWLDSRVGFATSSSVCGAIILATALLFIVYVLIMRLHQKWPITVPDSETSNSDEATSTLSVPAKEYGSNHMTADYNNSNV